jgi:hypothetical protein
MASRTTIALCLAALAWAGTARAQDNPACAQYHEAMAYNACLAQHGPKAKSVGTLHGRPQRGAQLGSTTPNRLSYGHRRTASNRDSYDPASATGSTRFYDTHGSKGIHGRVHMEFHVH